MPCPLAKTFKSTRSESSKSLWPVTRIAQLDHPRGEYPICGYFNAVIGYTGPTSEDKVFYRIFFLNPFQKVSARCQTSWTWGCPIARFEALKPYLTSTISCGLAGCWITEKAPALLWFLKDPLKKQYLDRDVKPREKNSKSLQSFLKWQLLIPGPQTFQPQRNLPVYSLN